MCHKCLFTGETLTKETRVEHTIPESLGGRLKSRIVSCDDFNNHCGSHLDETVKLIYEPILNYLAPLLPHAAKPGKMHIDVDGEPSGLILEDGRIDRINVLVEKDESGLPKSATASDEKVIRRIAQQMGKDPDDITVSWKPATDASTFYKRAPVICREVELAVLKSILLTFDHLLCDSPHRFSRHDSLEAIRTLIRNAVLSRTVDARLLGSVSLGLQYEKLGLYHDIRSKVSVPKTPFEHVLIANANGPCHCLDVVWLVFGFDPFGFRLTTDWRGELFTYVVVNPIVKGCGLSGPHELHIGDELICARTNRCSIPWNIADEKEMEPIMEFISQERGRAFCEAIELVQMTCDEHVIECFVEAGDLSQGEDRSVIKQVTDRLIRLYGRKKDRPDFIKKVSDVVSSCSFAIPTDLLQKRISNPSSLSSQEWDNVLSLYRNCMSELKKEFGTPGDWFRSSYGIIVDRSDDRLIGDLPEMK